jgi:ribosome-binding factor A
LPVSSFQGGFRLFFSLETGNRQLETAVKDYPRAARINTQLQQELSDLLRSGILRDPRLHDAVLTVTAVEAAQDLGSARVFVSWFGDDEGLEECVRALNRAAGKLRHALGERLRMRYVPTLHFAADRALREGDRLSALINKVVAEDARAAEEAAAASTRKPRSAAKRRSPK